MLHVLLKVNFILFVSGLEKDLGKAKEKNEANAFPRLRPPLEIYFNSPLAKLYFYRRRHLP